MTTFVPRFVELAGSEQSRRFVVLHMPPPAQPPRALVVHAPAFAEEMNKSRRMVAKQSRQMATDGCLVLLIDPLGCGDSPGDHGDAGWSDWVDDICAATVWLRSECRQMWPGIQDPPCLLWGLRSGALLAAAAARQLGVPCNLLFWQPAPSGKVVLNQFLRLLSASDIVAGGAPPGAGAAAREALARGAPIEVAGYRMSAALAAGMEAATLDPPQTACKVVMLEVGTSEKPSVAVTSALTRWQAAGWQAHAQVVPGPSFWQTTEIEDAPALLQETSRALHERLAQACESIVA